MTEEMSAGLWGALLGALAGGAVSFFSERHHDARRRRQQLADQFSDIAFDFVAAAQTYWSSTGKDSALEANIISGFNKLKAKVAQLGFDLVADKTIRLLLKEILQFSTGGSFATRGHLADPSRGRQVEQRIEKLSSIIAQPTSDKALAAPGALKKLFGLFGSRAGA